ncbi:MAG: hypothetical protein ABIE94_03275 [archaeon]
MASEKIIFPKKIETASKKELNDNLKKIKSKEDKEIYRFLFDIKKKQKEEQRGLENFIRNLRSKNLKNDFIQLIKSFKKTEVYERFLASTLIYSRVIKLKDDVDKFIYLCIAIEAAVNKTGTRKKKGQLFEDFFRDNLSEKSKLLMISNFGNKTVKNVVCGQELIKAKYLNPGKIRLKKIKKHHILPSCYKQKHCYIQYGLCYPEALCAIKSKVNLINAQLEFILKYIYTKRSNFVHNGVLFSVPNKNHTKFDSFRDPHTKKPLSVRLSLDFDSVLLIYEEALLNYFKNENKK